MHFAFIPPANEPKDKGKNVYSHIAIIDPTDQISKAYHNRCIRPAKSNRMSECTNTREKAAEKNVSRQPVK
ncbi:hypothetical protein PAXINDRAFT_166026 [Paxillus involutus ATCC 200175]|jgi:hypothetical protein|nr:hypothetical protein PAXINDRAFT_166026 [Paxillus involutus ATCC 200175]